MNTAQSMLPNLVSRLLVWERNEPSRPWLYQNVDGTRRVYTFADAATEIRRAASAIKNWGLPSGSRIGISGRNTAHWFFADLAITMAGHVAVGLYPKQGRATLGYILDHAEISRVFVGPSLGDRDAEDLVANLPPGVKTIGFPYAGVPATEQTWAELTAGHSPMESYSPPAPNSVGMLIYTSGTSGMPKGVMLTHESIAFAIDNILGHTMQPLANEVLFSYLPLAHLMERLQSEALSLTLGAEVHFLDKLDRLPQMLSEVRPTRFAGVPLVYSRIQAGILSRISQPKLDRLLSIPLFSYWFKRRLRRKMGLDRVAALNCGGAGVPVPQLEWFQRLGMNVYQGYGMTENCAYAAMEMPGKSRTGSVGQPLPGSGFRLATDGEIQFRHRAIMAGYFKDVVSTKAAFTEDGWLRTGDRGRVDKDGYLFIIGRIKDEFKTGKGRYVVPGGIEGAMARNTDLGPLCLVGTGLNQPILLASLNDNGRARPRHELEQELQADIRAVNRSLEDHEAIAQCVVVEENWNPDSGLTTPTGKVKRDAVENYYSALLGKVTGSRDRIIWWESDLRPALQLADVK